MTQEEINKVIEDKAKELYPYNPVLDTISTNRLNHKTVDDNWHDCEVCIKTLKEALSHPTDIGLCNFINASKRMPDKEDTYHTKICGHKQTTYFNGHRFETHDIYTLGQIEWLEE